MLLPVILNCIKKYSPLTILIFTVVLFSCQGQHTQPLLKSVAVSPAFIQKSLLYQRAHNGLGDKLEVRVAQFDEPEVWFNGRQITFDQGIQFSPAINNRLDIAYAQTFYANSEIQVVLNGIIVDDDKTVNFDLQLTEEALYWAKSRLYDSQYFVYRRDLANAQTIFAVLGFIPADLIINNGNLVVSGFSPDEDKYYLRVLDPSTLATIADFSFPDSIFLTQEGAESKFIVVSGSPELRRAFFAYREFYGDQRTEPFSFGNDYMGRVSWNQIYRLLGMNELYHKTEDPIIANSIRIAIRNLLRNTNESGRWISKKYSINQSDSLEFVGHDALIYYSILRNIGLLSAAEQNKVLELAVNIFQYYEKDWIGQYRATPCSSFAWDGIPLPYNYQSMMGLLAIQLYQLTGQVEYKARVDALFNNLKNELVNVGGKQIWHYWPQTFYNGWNEKDYKSCYALSYPPSIDTLYEDTFHAYYNIEFLYQAAELLETSTPIDIDGIAEQVEIEKNVFARFISGDVEYQKPDFRFLPWFTRAKRIADYYTKLIVLPSVDFDRQSLFLAYAASSKREILAGDNLRLQEFVLQGIELKPIREIHFTESNTGCMILKEGVKKHSERCTHAIAAYWLALTQTK